MEFLRGLVGVIGIGCAYMVGRSAVAVRHGWQKPGRLYGWVIRMLVCLGAVAFRHSIDTALLIIAALAAVAFSAALWDTSREKKRDEPPHIFPD